MGHGASLRWGGCMQHSLSPMVADGFAVMAYSHTSADRLNGQNCSHREIVNKSNQAIAKIKLGH